MLFIRRSTERQPIRSLGPMGRLSRSNFYERQVEKTHGTGGSHFVLTRLIYRKKDVGASALTCYLHACRQNDEVKTRKYLSRVIWLLAFDDESVRLSIRLLAFVASVVRSEISRRGSGQIRDDCASQSLASMVSI